MRTWIHRGPVVVLLAMLAVVPPSSAQNRPAVLPEVPVTAQDIRLQPSNNSPAVAVDPTEPRFMVVANRLDNPDFACALHVSGDAGRTWVPASPVPELPEGARKCYAPEVLFDEDGTLYYLFLGLHGRGNQPMGAFLTKSTNRAQSFSEPRRLLGPLNYMVRLAIDPGSGRLHLVWLHATSDPPLGGLPQPPNPIMAAYSDDGGQTFSEPAQVNDPGRSRVVAPAVSVGPGGNVHVVYYDLLEDRIDYEGLEGETWEGPWELAAASSTDGGETWGVHSSIDDAVVPPERVMLIFTMPPASVATGNDGTVYVAWHDARNGDWDVFLRRSSDGARTWSDVVRVNDDDIGNGAHQYMPKLAVAPKGRLDAIFYDRREDPENLRNHVSFTFSNDRAGTFSPAVTLTADPSDARAGTTYAVPSAANLIEFGSRLGLASDDDSATAAWTDTRNNPDSRQQDIYVTAVRWPAKGPNRGVWLVTAVILVGLAAVAARRLKRATP